MTTTQSVNPVPCSARLAGAARRVLPKVDLTEAVTKPKREISRFLGQADKTEKLRKRPGCRRVHWSKKNATASPLHRSPLPVSASESGASPLRRCGRGERAAVDDPTNEPNEDDDDRSPTSIMPEQLARRIVSWDRTIQRWGRSRPSLLLAQRPERATCDTARRGRSQGPDPLGELDRRTAGGRGGPA